MPPARKAPAKRTTKPKAAPQTAAQRAAKARSPEARAERAAATAAAQAVADETAAVEGIDAPTLEAPPVPGPPTPEEAADLHPDPESTPVADEAPTLEQERAATIADALGGADADDLDEVMGAGPPPPDPAPLPEPGQAPNVGPDAEPKRDPSEYPQPMPRPGSITDLSAQLDKAQRLIEEERHDEAERLVATLPFLDIGQWSGDVGLLLSIGTAARRACAGARAVIAMRATPRIDVVEQDIAEGTTFGIVAVAVTNPVEAWRTAAAVCSADQSAIVASVDPEGVVDVWLEPPNSVKPWRVMGA